MASGHQLKLSMIVKSTLCPQTHHGYPSSRHEYCQCDSLEVDTHEQLHGHGGGSLILGRGGILGTTCRLCFNPCHMKHEEKALCVGQHRRGQGCEWHQNFLCPLLRDNWLVFIHGYYIKKSSVIIKLDIVEEEAVDGGFFRY